MAGYGSLRKPEPYFDDPRFAAASTNWNALFEEVKADVFKINNSTTSLERTAKQLGTARDSASIRERLSVTERKTDELIHQAMKGMRQLSDASSSAGKDKDLHVKKLENDFKDTLQRYKNVQNNILERARAAIGTPPSNPFEDNYQDDQALVEAGRVRDEQLQVQAERAEQDLEFLRDREDRMRQLETDITDINQIFRELAMLVNEQGETITSIAENVVKASDYVEGGNQQLEQAATYQRKSRRKVCILLIIVVVVAGVVGLIIYLSVRK